VKYEFCLLAIPCWIAFGKNTHTPTHTHSLTYSLTHSHSPIHSRSPTCSLTLTHPLTHSPTHTSAHTHALSYNLTYTHALFLTLSHSHTLAHTYTSTEVISLIRGKNKLPDLVIIFGFQNFCHLINLFPTLINLVILWGQSHLLQETYLAHQSCFNWVDQSLSNPHLHSLHMEFQNSHFQILS
jgi:hypothetical protein